LLTDPLRYMGKKASQYEAKRSHTRKWRLEHDAVASLLPDAESVLDVPVGTGRFFPLYDGMRVTGVDISPDMLAEARKRGFKDLHLGDIRDMRFADGRFDVAVCMRLLNWLTPSDMAQAVKELSRVASILIVGLRAHRDYPTCKGRLWVHSLAYCREIIADSGLLIDRDVNLRGGTYSIYRLCHKPPCA